MAEETVAKQTVKRRGRRSGNKPGSEAIKKMIATKRAKREARERAAAEMLPLRVNGSTDDVTEFAAFMAAAWKVYKGL